MTYTGVGYIGDGNNPVDYLTGNQGDSHTVLPILGGGTAIGPVLQNGYILKENSDFTLVSRFVLEAGIPTSYDDFIVKYRIWNQTRLAFQGSTNTPAYPANTGPSSTLSLQQRMDLLKDWMETNTPNRLNPEFSTSNSISSATYDDVLNTFAAALGINTENWKVYANGTVVDLSSNATTYRAYVKALLNDTFGEFLRTVSVPIDAAATPNTNWLNAVTEGFSKYIANWASVRFNIANKLNYQSFYAAFFASSGFNYIPDFEAFFAKFVKEQYGDPLSSTPTTGTFNPSLSYDEWTSYVLKEYYNNTSISTPLGNSSAYGDGDKTSVLTRIINLLIGMTESLQKVAAAQSERLGVYARWQNAYTDLQNGVRFAASDDVRFNSNFTGNTDKRGDYNSANSSFTEIIKARKSTVADDAKNFQTQVNQSSDAVNQQTNMATSVLQQLSTLLQAIYR